MGEKLEEAKTVTLVIVGVLVGFAAGLLVAVTATFIVP